MGRICRSVEWLTAMSYVVYNQWSGGWKIWRDPQLAFFVNSHVVFKVQDLCTKIQFHRAPGELKRHKLQRSETETGWENSVELTRAQPTGGKSGTRKQWNLELLSSTLLRIVTAASVGLSHIMPHLAKSFSIAKVWLHFQEKPKSASWKLSSTPN